MGTADFTIPIIDLSSPGKLSTSRLVRVLMESKKLFSLPLDEKMVMMARHGFRGYSPLYDEKFESSNASKELLPLMECYYRDVMEVGRELLGLVALALNLEENFFERVGAFNAQASIVRLLHYPGELNSSEEETIGSSAHSDAGMITLLATDGVPGLQVCRDKDKEPRVWEDVPGVKGAFLVNIGDLMQIWTNGLFRLTMRTVILVGKERYPVAVFVDPDPNCIVECLESCCSETSPPRFPPICARDYFHEWFSRTLASYFDSALSI